MPLAQTAHLNTFYQEIGKHPETLILLHGWGNSWESWSPLIPTLSQQYRLIIPDLPGFGKSDSPHSGWNMAQYSQWLNAFLLEVHKDGTPITAVIGHSFGGKVAAFAWMAHAPLLHLPEITTGIFLIDPSGISPRPTPRMQFSAAVTGLIPRSLKTGLLQPLRRWWYVSVLDEQDYFLATPFQAETLRRILPQDIRHEVTKPTSLPLHILWGEKDTAVESWMAYPFAALSTESDVCIVPSAGHFPHHTHKKMFLDWITTWL